MAIKNKQKSNLTKPNTREGLNYDHVLKLFFVCSSVANKNNKNKTTNLKTSYYIPHTHQ